MAAIDVVEDDQVRPVVLQLDAAHRYVEPERDGVEAAGCAKHRLTPAFRVSVLVFEPPPYVAADALKDRLYRLKVPVGGVLRVAEVEREPALAAFGEVGRTEFCEG